MLHSRRRFIVAVGAMVTGTALPRLSFGADQPQPKKHIVTLSFDDGFQKSSIKTAEIYEKYKLSACLNVVASAHMKDFRPPDYRNVPRADFGLWNELKARGHEVMPQPAQITEASHDRPRRMVDARGRCSRRRLGGGVRR
jgi:hypothetical protein